MLTSARNALGVAVLGGVGAALLEPRLAAADKETQIKDLSKLPDAVMTAAKEKAKDAVWKVATKIENGMDVSYEIVGVITKGKDKRLITLEIDDDGDIFHIERQIAEKDVPAKVMKCFKNKLAADKITNSKLLAVFHVEDIEEDPNAPPKTVTTVTYEFLTDRRRDGEKGKGKGKGKGKAAKPKTEEEPITIVVDEAGTKAVIEGEEDE